MKTPLIYFCSNTSKYYYWYYSPDLFDGFVNSLKTLANTSFHKLTLTVFSKVLLKRALARLSALYRLMCASVSSSSL
uniref:Putative ovule protein n=1 Tax=Solanum chacoense TaxID=4108 RepID=A0A0V0H3E3_SOLCH